MQSKHRLLVFGLGRHGPHPRLVRCRPDRACIGRVGLVCLYEWANELRMQEHHLVTKRLDLARPPMPAPARFQRHPTRGSLSQKAYQLITRKPTIHDLTALHIDPVQLECTLCNVQAICRSIHFGPSVPQVAVSKLHFGTLMPFGPGGPSCFLLGPSSPKGGRCPCHLGAFRDGLYRARLWRKTYEPLSLPPGDPPPVTSAWLVDSPPPQAVPRLGPAPQIPTPEDLKKRAGFQYEGTANLKKDDLV